jgi:hypothetical protein
MMPEKTPTWYHKAELDHVDDVVENATRHWQLDNLTAEKEYKQLKGIQLLLSN